MTRKPPSKRRLERKATPKITSFNFDIETHELINACAEQLGLTRVAVVRMAVRQFARAQGVDAKGKPGTGEQ